MCLRCPHCQCPCPWCSATPYMSDFSSPTGLLDPAAAQKSRLSKFVAAAWNLPAGADPVVGVLDGFGNVSTGEIIASGLEMYGPIGTGIQTAHGVAKLGHNLRLLWQARKYHKLYDGQMAEESQELGQLMLSIDQEIRQYASVYAKDLDRWVLLPRRLLFGRVLSGCQDLLPLLNQLEEKEPALAIEYCASVLRTLYASSAGIPGLDLFQEWVQCVYYHNFTNPDLHRYNTPPPLMTLVDGNFYISGPLQLILNAMVSEFESHAPQQNPLAESQAINAAKIANAKQMASDVYRMTMSTALIASGISVIVLTEGAGATSGCTMILKGIGGIADHFNDALGAYIEIDLQNRSVTGVNAAKRIVNQAREERRQIHQQPQMSAPPSSPVYPSSGRFHRRGTSPARPSTPVQSSPAVSAPIFPNMDTLRRTAVRPTPLLLSSPPAAFGGSLPSAQSGVPSASAPTSDRKKPKGPPRGNGNKPS